MAICLALLEPFRVNDILQKSHEYVVGFLEKSGGANSFAGVLDSWENSWTREN